MTIFDFHVHAFTDQLAERALAGLSDTSGITPATDGTVSGLRSLLRKRGISGGLLLPIATKPAQQTTINNWAAEIMVDGLLCCGTVHPDAPDVLEEVSRIRSLGLYGVKFHPEYQFFSPDEHKMFPIYERIAAEDLIAVFHAGWDPYGKERPLAPPQSFANIAGMFPQMKIVAAHMGGIKLWDDVEKLLAGRYDNLWFDTGVVSKYISDEQFLRIIRKQGIERVLFGSDCPWDDPGGEISLLRRLPLTDAELERIFFRNAEELLDLKLSGQI